MLTLLVFYYTLTRNRIPRHLRAFVSIKTFGGKWKQKLLRMADSSYRFAMKWAYWEDGVVLRASGRSCRNVLFIVRTSLAAHYPICILAPCRFCRSYVQNYTFPISKKNHKISLENISFFLSLVAPDTSDAMYQRLAYLKI